LIVADTIINKDPQSYDGYKIKFEIFYSLKEYDKAFEILDTIVNRHLFKDQRDVKMLLGRIHYDLGNWYDSYHAFRAGHYYLEYIYKPLHHIKKIAQNKDTKAKDFLKSIEETEDSYSKMALDPLEATSYKKALKLFEKAGNFITKGTEEFRFYVHEC
jgi:tetratricopeptide (TPR) repeat protein